MKRVLIFLFFVAIASCGRTNDQSPRYDEIQTGDLLFIELPADYDIIDKSYVAVSDSRVTIHVAILENTSEGIYVVDATSKKGVDRHPIDTLLSTFRLRSGKFPDVEIKRLTDNSSVAEYVEKAKSYSGSEYDLEFSITNEKYYCSELVSLAYLDESGNPIFPIGEKDYTANDGSFAKYFIQLVQFLGTSDNADDGIMPKTILQSEQVRSVNFDPSLFE